MLSQNMLMFLIRGGNKKYTSLNPELEKRRFWYITLFNFRDTVIPKIIFRLFIILIINIILCVLQELHIWNPPQLRFYAHQLVGIALGLLLVYRTNSSYDRFHEGRRQWGSIVNNCRNLLRFVRTVDREVDIRQLANLTAAYCFSLKERLRGVTKLDDFVSLLRGGQVEFVDKAKNKPAAISTLISDWIWVNCDRCRQNYELYRIAEQYLGFLMDSQGALERIVQTPIPYSYVVQVHQILTIYLLTLPFCLFHDYGWYSIAATLCISFSLLGVEQAGIEMEDPFGYDKGDLPLDNICAVIWDNLTFFAEKKEMLVERVAQSRISSKLTSSANSRPPSPDHFSKEALEVQEENGALQQELSAALEKEVKQSSVYVKID